MSTPHQISILLHHYVSSAPWPLGKTNAYDDDSSYLIQCGILEDESDGIRVTEKGRAWVAAILGTPFPQRKSVWTDACGNQLEVR